MCRDFTNFQKIPPACELCGVMWEDFELFRFPWVWVLSMAFSTVVERSLTFKKNPCWEFFPCGRETDYFRKKSCAVLGENPCAGEIDFFWVKIPVLERLIFSGENPCAEDFLAPFSPKNKR